MICCHLPRDPAYFPGLKAINYNKWPIQNAIQSSVSLKETKYIMQLITVMNIVSGACFKGVQRLQSRLLCTGSSPL